MQVDPYLRLLLYRKPGSTKTRTAGTAVFDERTHPVLYLNAAGNPISIREYDPAPDVIEIEQLKDVNEPYDWIRKGQPENHPFVKRLDLNPPYKTLVVDQLTDVQRMSFAHVTGNKNLAPGNHPERVQRQHFGSVLGQMVNFAKLYFDLPLHVIMTCLEKTTVNELTGAVTYSPLLWGQSDTEVPGYAYCVARLVHRSQTSKKVLRIVEDVDDSTVSVAFFTPGGTFYAKDQYGALGPWMADPSIPKMVDLIFGSQN
jgi:hypothetical protein